MSNHIRNYSEKANCYAYSMNSDGNVVPGGGNAGRIKKETEEKYVERLKEGVEGDGGTPVEGNTANVPNPSPNTYLTALFVNHNSTGFHFIRRDKDGSWSWKWGSGDKFAWTKVGIHRKILGWKWKEIKDADIKNLEIKYATAMGWNAGWEFKCFFEIPDGGCDVTEHAVNL